jgi:Rad3-related DNA helicase
VIDSHQAWVGVVGKSRGGKVLNSSYQNRGSEEYQMELGRTVMEIAGMIKKGGILVFFPSYGGLY